MPAQAATKPPDGTPRIERHKTALPRKDFSRPIARALFDGLITEETTVFDYGCGRGGDVKRLSEMSIDVVGFDPNFAPETELRPSRIVNLGFVVNVIEDPKERAEVLLKAWELTEGVLIVSARLMDEAQRLEAKDFGDGVLTDLGTFQKFYEQSELRVWIEEVIGVEPVAAEPGIFYVFRHSAEAQLFLLTRVRRNPPAPKRSEAAFQEHEDLLNNLMGFFEENGRLPRKGEFAQEAELRESVGTPREAWRVVLNITEQERWDRVRVARYEELLVQLSLAHLRKLTRFEALPASTQYSIRDFFGSYKRAISQARSVLDSLGDRDRMNEAIRAARVGRVVKNSLFVHESALHMLPVVLQVLAGIARELLGSVEHSEIIKFSRSEPNVVFLCYPNFEESSHPKLTRAYSVVVPTMQVKFREFPEDQQPLLRNKDGFLPPSVQ